MHLTNVVPAKAGTHTPCALSLKDAVVTLCDNHVRQGLWVPAFAGTT
jgi:hypothetical protein